MQDVIESIIKSRVDGVILFNDNFSEEELEVLHLYQIPMVVVGSKIEDHKVGNVGNVYVDFERLAYELVNSYFERGITDISLVEDKLNLSMMSQLRRGVERAYEQRGMEFKKYISYDDTYRSSYDFLSEYFQNHKPSELVITFRDSQAIAFINACNEANYLIPQDTQVISILDDKYLRMVRPTISSFNFPDYDMGAIAMRLLTKVLVNDDEVKDNKDIEIGFTFIQRQTTKPEE